MGHPTPVEFIYYACRQDVRCYRRAFYFSSKSIVVKNATKTVLAHLPAFNSERSWADCKGQL
jgi:hypothetical protein